MMNIWMWVAIALWALGCVMLWLECHHHTERVPIRLVCASLFWPVLVLACILIYFAWEAPQKLYALARARYTRNPFRALHDLVILALFGIAVAFPAVAMTLMMIGR